MQVSDKSEEKIEIPDRFKSPEWAKDRIQEIVNGYCECHTQIIERRLISPKTGEKYNADVCRIPLWKWPCCHSHTVFRVNIFNSCRCKLCYEWIINDTYCASLSKKWSQHYNEIVQTHYKSGLINAMDDKDTYLDNGKKLSECTEKEFNSCLKKCGFTKDEQREMKKKWRLINVDEIESEKMTKKLEKKVEKKVEKKDKRKMVENINSIEITKMTDTDFLNLPLKEFNKRLRQADLTYSQAVEIRRRRSNLKTKAKNARNYARKKC